MGTPVPAAASASVPAAVPPAAPGGRQLVPGQLSGAAMLCLVFLPYALGHYLSCLLRTVNAVLAPQLAGAAGLAPADLGLLTSVYFLAFAVAQLPVGIALDRFGPRPVQGAMLLLAALGTLGFASSGDFAQMLCARMAMGLGLAGCFMAALKAIATWGAPARLPSMQGYLVAAGGLGAASSTLPVQVFVRHVDWRWLFVALALCCVAAALLVLRLAPTPPAAPRKAQPPVLKAFAEVLRHRAFRETVSLVLVPHTVFFGIQGLWIGRWLTDVGGHDASGVAWLLYVGMGAVMVGAIAVGKVTEWAARRGIGAIDVAATGVVLFVVVQCGLVLGWRPSCPVLAVLFTLVGTVTGIEYTIVAQAMPPALTGRASTCLNLLIFSGAFAVQAGFGVIVGLWPPDAAQRYPAAAYHAAFLVLVLLQLPGIACFCRRRRGGPRRTL